MSKQAYQEKLGAQLAEWDAKLDLIKAKAKNLQADARIEYERQLEALQQRRHETLRRLEDLRKRSEAAWEDLKEGTERAWSELAKASHGKLRLTFQIGEPEEVTEKIAMTTQIDPVCGMQLNEQETADTSVYEGKTYYFCSRDCKEVFDTEPELYLSGDRRAPWSE